VRNNSAAARNFGLEHVETDYVIFLDADDALLDGALRYLRSQIDAAPSISVLVTSILDSETGERHRTPCTFVPALARGRTGVRPDRLGLGLFPLQGCSIMRTAQVREAGGYADADWDEDWVVAVSLAHRGRAEVSKRLGRLYRPTPGSLWRRRVK
jgi:glycosyltransferase involved in cell wall biosynthesis